MILFAGVPGAEAPGYFHPPPRGWIRNWREIAFTISAARRCQTPNATQDAPAKALEF
jgi:hypothetical protein